MQGLFSGCNRNKQLDPTFKLGRFRKGNTESNKKVGQAILMDGLWCMYLLQIQEWWQIHQLSELLRRGWPMARVTQLNLFPNPKSVVL